MGFLFASIFLIGLLTVAWPIYLHLFVVRRQIQEVPSLKIIEPYLKNLKRKNYQHLLLLLSRVFLLCCLVAFLAQPFWKTDKDLDLPPVSGETETKKYLGILLDDSLCSVDSKGSESRLELSVSYLKKYISSLPENVEYTLCPVSYPYATGFMKKAEILQLLGRIKSMPFSNNAFKAMTALQERLKDKKASIIVAAPRLQQIWDFDQPSAFSGAIHFMDLTDHSSGIAITSARFENYSGKRELTISLQGDSPKLEKKVLLLQGPDFEVRHPISVIEAERRQVLLSFASLPENITISLQDTGGNPWLKYYLKNFQNNRHEDRAIIFTKGRRDATAAAIIKAVLESKGDMKCLTLSSTDKELPEAGVFVFIGYNSLPAAWKQQLSARIKQGVTLLFVPSGKNNSTEIVSWQKPVAMNPADYPLSFAEGKSINEGRDLLLSGLDMLPVQIYTPPDFITAGYPVLVTARGKSLLSYSQLGEESSAWALGFSLDLNKKGPVYHPLFPLFIKRIIDSANSQETLLNSCTVGEMIPADRLCGRGNSAFIVAPDGHRKKHLKDGGKVEFSQTGFYQLQRASKGHSIAVNFPRPQKQSVIDQENFDKLWPGMTWLTSGETEQPALTFIKNNNREDKYDLTPLAAFLLLLFITGEELFLFLIWRKREAHV